MNRLSLSIKEKRLAQNYHREMRNVFDKGLARESAMVIGQ